MGIVFDNCKAFSCYEGPLSSAGWKAQTKALLCSCWSAWSQQMLASLPVFASTAGICVPPLKEKVCCYTRIGPTVFLFGAMFGAIRCHPMPRSLWTPSGHWRGGIWWHWWSHRNSDFMVTDSWGSLKTWITWCKNWLYPQTSKGQMRHWKYQTVNMNMHKSGWCSRPRSWPAESKPIRNAGGSCHMDPHHVDGPWIIHILMGLAVSFNLILRRDLFAKSCHQSVFWSIFSPDGQDDSFCLRQMP